MNKRLILVTILVGLIAIIQLFAVASPSDPVNVLRDQEGAVAEIVHLLEQGKEQAALEELNGLHEVVINSRAALTGLSFEGRSGKSLTDPFTLTSGTYRVHFTTEGFGAVKIIPLREGREDLLFNVSMGGATEGASTIYRSSGKKIMVQFSNISEPYKLVFEQLG